MNTLNSPQKDPIKLIPENEKINAVTQDYFSSVNGFLSFYTLKSISRTPIIENILAKGVLKADGNFIIYFNSKEFINMPHDVKENLKCKYGFGFMLFPETLFFKGSIMDGFDYNHLSKNISTYIVNGDVVPFNKAKRTSSIGKITKIEDVIQLDSSISITYKNDGITELEKHSKSTLIGVDISMQFKKGAA